MKSFQSNHLLYYEMYDTFFSFMGMKELRYIKSKVKNKTKTIQSIGAVQRFDLHGLSEEESIGGINGYNGKVTRIAQRVERKD